MHIVTSAMGELLKRSNAGLLLGSVLFAMGTAGAWADAIQDLQGAWVMDGTKCTAVFDTNRGKLRFKNRTFASEHGFIISGRKVLGPIAGCKISDVVEENNHFSAHLACSDAHLERDFSMKFRIIDPTHFERTDKFRDFTIKYQRCSP